LHQAVANGKKRIEEKLQHTRGGPRPTRDSSVPRPTTSHRSKRL
jgi:hypothetical protein